MRPCSAIADNGGSSCLCLPLDLGFLAFRSNSSSEACSPSISSSSCQQRTFGSSLHRYTFLVSLTPSLPAVSERPRLTRAVRTYDENAVKVDPKRCSWVCHQGQGLDAVHTSIKSNSRQGNLRVPQARLTHLQLHCVRGQCRQILYGFLECMEAGCDVCEEDLLLDCGARGLEALASANGLYMGQVPL